MTYKTDMTTTRSDFLIRRPAPWNKGRAMPSVRADFDRDYWTVVVEHRRHEWPPLDEAAYKVRFHRLSYRYHPAVAAILAHDPTSGCRNG